jgi:hypothetical protein|tara:strand:- start:3428 stop:3607 length:180 start_codon:yes stop_codon:yes gene_type:complete
MATAVENNPTAVPEAADGPNSGQGDEKTTDRVVKDDKVELQDSDAWEVLGYSFPTWRKW